MPRPLPIQKTGTILAMLIIQENKNPNSPSPTLHELMQVTGYRSPNSIRKHLKKLEQEGIIEHKYYKHRDIRLTPKGKAIAALITAEKKQDLSYQVAPNTKDNCARLRKPGTGNNEK